MYTSAFSTYHPAVIFAFFVEAIVLCVMCQQPLFQVVGLGASCALLLVERGRRASAILVGAAIMLVVIAVLNPLFNTQGVTVLFWFLGRPFTFESLIYGISTAAMFVTALLLFASLAHLIISAKFTYLFAPIVPTATLVITMVMRLVPAYQRKAQRIIDARRCVGCFGANETMRMRIRGGAIVLSSLTTWSLESSLITADSMRSRGYGSGKRTSFTQYHFDRRSTLLLVLLLALGVLAGSGVVTGLFAVQFIPSIKLVPFSLYDWICFGAFAVLMGLPVFIDCIGRVKWRSMQLKI